MSNTEPAQDHQDPVPSKPPSPPRLRGSDLPKLKDDEPEEVVPDTLSAVSGLDIKNLETLYELNELLLADSIPPRPLIAEIASLSVLREEYENGSPNFLKQIDSLIVLGFKSFRRARGDGDCFYRSIAFAYVDRLMHAKDPEWAVQSSLSILSATLPMLESVGFHSLVYEDFHAALEGLIRRVPSIPGSQEALNESALLKMLQDPEVSNSIVMYFRLVTSARIRSHEEEFAPFLIHPDLQEVIPARSFCEAFVEVTGKEADHVQIMALSQALQLNLQIAYLDGHSDEINFVDFRYAEGSDITPIVLLYRPGHYDILGTTTSEK